MEAINHIQSLVALPRQQEYFGSLSWNVFKIISILFSPEGTGRGGGGKEKAVVVKISRKKKIMKEIQSSTISSV